MTTPKIGNIRTVTNNECRVAMTAEVVGCRTVKISAWGTDRAHCIRKLRRIFEKTANELIAEEARNAKWEIQRAEALETARRNRKDARAMRARAEAERKKRVEEQNANLMDPDEAYRRARAMTPKKDTSSKSSEEVKHAAGRYILVDGVVEFV